MERMWMGLFCRNCPRFHLFWVLFSPSQKKMGVSTAAPLTNARRTALKPAHLLGPQCRNHLFMPCTDLLKQHDSQLPFAILASIIATLLLLPTINLPAWYHHSPIQLQSREPLTQTPEISSSPSLLYGRASYHSLRTVTLASSDLQPRLEFLPLKKVVTMSSVQPQHGWLGETFNYTHDSAQLPLTKCMTALGRLDIIPRWACLGASPWISSLTPSLLCRLVSILFASRKVRCDGGKPKCSLCTRLNRPCDYVKVTAEENAVLRDKKRQSKLRKNAEQEAARTNFHQHDTFPAYHPYRSAIVASLNTFGSDDRVGLQPPPLPHVGGSTSSLVPPNLYDGKYSSTGAVGVGLFDVGAGLNGSRRPSIKGLLAGHTVSSGVACAPKQSLEGYTRSSEPQSRYDTVIDSLSDPNFSTSLNIITAPTTTTTAFSTLTFSDANSFRPDETDNGVRYAQRYIGSAAFIPQSEYEVASPIYPECFDRERSSISTISGSTSVASPSYNASLPALECRPSSSGSGASASPASIHPETTPQHDDASHWSGHQPMHSSGYAQNPLSYHRAYEQARVEKPYHEHTFPSSGGDSSSASVDPWTKHVPMGAATHLAVGNKAWDSVASLYSTTI